MNHIESDTYLSHVVSTNEHPRSLGEVYLLVLSQVLSMESVVGNPQTSRM
jgi:hypothetical protein